MTRSDEKSDLLSYLQSGRDALLLKLADLDEYDLRRPMVDTGTNLLGLVKHMAGVEAGYLGGTFDRPYPELLPWMAEDAEPNADMWATAEESSEQVSDLYRRVWAHGNQTVETLPLDALGHVPWWPASRNEVTLHQILVHLIAETHRHAGHADIVRELVDGTVGLRAVNDNLAPGDAGWWQRYRSRLQAVAESVRDGSARRD